MRRTSDMHPSAGRVTLHLSQEEAALLLSLSRYVLAEVLRQQDIVPPPRPAPVQTQASAATPPLLLTMSEAASLLRINRTTLYRLVQEGVIARVHIGRLSRIPFAALADYAARLPLD